ncbi:peptidase (fragment) [Lactobacillus delbrueckii subsp. lactis]
MTEANDQIAAAITAKGK